MEEAWVWRVTLDNVDVKSATCVVKRALSWSSEFDTVGSLPRVGVGTLTVLKALQEVNGDGWTCG